MDACPRTMVPADGARRAGSPVVRTTKFISPKEYWRDDDTRSVDLAFERHELHVADDADDLVRLVVAEIQDAFRRSGCRPIHQPRKRFH